MRYDDPGNMCYGATGKILLSGLDGVVEKWMLQEFADMYALLDKPKYAKLSKEPKKLLGVYLLQAGFIRSIDDKWDLASIGYGYDAF